MFVSINKKPSSFNLFVTKHSAKNVKIGIKNPTVLKNRRTLSLVNFCVEIILSLITAETTIETKQNMNGIEDNLPF